MTEDNIKHERGDHFVLKVGKSYEVLTNKSGYSEVDSAYDDLSVAKSRVNYLYKRDELAGDIK